ncbi:unnamed protein product [Albugo candida]|uniref:Uncharacterized protein n=1 Tax=Albugo candida TaxID=65357 RepID=A0A024GJ57_9STRA|nr:unnamed protein product [Albugo candida]|eukprot:CCI46746.1 unnamed protein product [Albugo candida]
MTPISRSSYDCTFSCRSDKQQASMSFTRCIFQWTLPGVSLIARNALHSDQELVKNPESDKTTLSPAYTRELHADTMYPLIADPAESISTPSISTSDPHGSSVATATDDPLDQNRAIPTKDAYHMQRVCKSRTSAKYDLYRRMKPPALILKKSAYLAAMDSVNTESVEGVLVYV